MAFLDEFLSGLGGQQRAVPSQMPSPSPAFPQGAPAAPPQDDGGGMQRFQQILQLVLPAIASSMAYKQGALGSMTGGMLDVRQMQQRQQESQLDQQYRQEQLSRQERAEQRQMEQDQRQADRDERQAQAQEMAQQLAEEKRTLEEGDRRRQTLSRHVRAVADNPLSNAMVAAFGPESMMLEVPGIGNVSLREALASSPNGKVGVLEKPKEKPQGSFVTSYEGPNDTGILKKAGEGVTVKPRPRVPRAEPRPPAPDRSTVREVDGDGAIRTYRVTIGADGKQSKVQTGGPPPEAVDAADPLGLR